MASRERKPFTGITSQMEDWALIRKAITVGDAPNNPNAIADWEEIFRALRRDGPFSKMMLKLRNGAVEAMGELLIVDPMDIPKVRALQADVQRLLEFIYDVNIYRQEAEFEASQRQTGVDDNDAPTDEEVSYLVKAETGEE